MRIPGSIKYASNKNWLRIPHPKATTFKFETARIIRAVSVLLCSWFFLRSGRCGGFGSCLFRSRLRGLFLGLGSRFLSLYG